MKPSSMVRTALALALAITSAAPLAGCAKKAETEGTQARVKPPLIAEAGVLKAGVDMDYPPFGAKVDGQQVGLDVDVAAALADKLGLELRIVDMKPSEIPTALAGGDIDIGLGADPISKSALADVSVAGSYVDDGPALFSKNETTLTATTLGGKKVVAQSKSPAYWALEDVFGEGAVPKVKTLREGFERVEAGEADAIAGDAIIGAYLTRDFPQVHYAGQLGPAVPLGVTVDKNKPELEEAVREALDGLAAAGVLEAIRAKWAPLLPELAGASEATETPAP